MTRINIGLLLLMTLPASLPAYAQSGVAESQPYFREANEARAAGNFEAYTAALERAQELNPASYYTRYSLVRGYAQTGKPGRAFELLRQLQRARVDFGVADDELLAPLHDDPRFAALLADLEAVTRPVVTSRTFFTVHRGDLVAEGIAWDAGNERLFFGSMRNGEVYAIDSDGTLGKFAEVANEGRLAAVGMTVDPGQGLLWVIGMAFFLTEGFDESATQWSGVFGFDLDDGTLRHKVLRDDVGQGYNDVAVAPNGDLYLSGAEMGVLRYGGDTIETLETGEPVYGSNGIVITPDGSHLLTSAYPASIAVVRLADGKTWFPPGPADIPLYGIDGMYYYEGDLIAVQNGVSPWRLMRFALNDDLTRITAARALEFGNPASVPTTGAIIGNTIRYIGQAGTDAEPPAYLPDALHPYFGATVIMTAPLD